MHVEFGFSRSRAQLSHQSQKVEFPPRFRNLVSSNAVNHDAGELNPAIRRNYALKFASMRAATRDSQHDAVVLGDDILDGVVGIRK